MSTADILPVRVERGGHRQAPVGQRERVAGLQRRCGRDGPGGQPRLPGREDDRDHQLADRRLHLPEPPVQHRRADPGQPAVVGLVLGRQAGVGDRADHSIHRPGLDLHRLRQRLPRRQREQRQLRHAQVPDGSDWSSVIETTLASAAQTVSYNVTGGLSTGTVHVWSTDVNSTDPSTWFVHSADITPVGGSFSLTVQPGYVYTLTTTTGQGKGTAASPAQGSLACPTPTTSTATPSAAAAVPIPDQGAFEVEPCAGGRSGQCVQQQAPVTADRMGQQRQPLHDRRRRRLDQLHRLGGRADGAVRRCAAHRAGRLPDRLLPACGQRILPAAVRHRRPGRWCASNSGGTLATLASGTVAAPGTGTWQHLALTFSGGTIIGGNQRHHRRHRHRFHLCRRA